jgi:Domain of unknown function (DUF4350)
VRGWVAAGAGVLALFVALGLASEAFTPAPQGPAGSSYATTPAGAAAWAELLSRSGHPILPLRVSLDQVRLPPGATLVVLDASSLSSAAGRNLDRFVRAGGRLVLGGGDPAATLPTLVEHPPGWTASGPIVAHPVARAPEIAGVGTVRTAGAGAWTSGPGTPLLAGARGSGPIEPVVMVLALGHGRLDLLADAAPVENRLLASADNAQLALDLAGPPGTPVLFAEELHGFGQATGLAAIPTRWWLVFAGLCLAWAAWALARGRRIGPPDAPGPADVPPRSEYVDAMARLLVRGRRRGELEQLVREAAERNPSRSPA